MQRTSLVALLLWLAAPVAGWCQAQTPPPPDAAVAAVACDLPAEFITPDAAMPHLAGALAGHKVNILAVGSGSTVGDTSGAGGPAFVYRNPTASFPYRMQQALQAAKPAVTFSLTVTGGRNLTAEDMLPLLQKELAAHHYDLVLWQTGTVEAVRGMRPEAMRDVIEQGIEAADTSGADVVVVDPQFSRFLRANTDLGPYESALQQIVTMTGMTLFHRYDLTHAWAAAGSIDLERVAQDGRDAMIGTLNVCLGRALARLVLAGAEEPSR